MLLKGDTAHTTINPNAARKGLPLTSPQPLVPVAALWFSVFFLRGYLLVLYLSQNYTIFLIVQLFY